MKATIAESAKPAVNESTDKVDESNSTDITQKTEEAVKKWQKEHNLYVDGIVGIKTLTAMGIPAEETEPQETEPQETDILLHQHYLLEGEYLEAKNQVNKYMFLHHTAGGNNPYSVVDYWSKDKSGHVATEFVLGGTSVRGDKKYDGTIVQCFPNRNCWAYHLGITSKSDICRTSVGVEICGYGYVRNDKTTYTGQKVDDSQIITLEKPFRGYKMWQRYSDKQLEQLRKLILYVGNRDNIDMHEGLYKLIKEKGADAFEYNQDAFDGKIRGLLTHANVRKDKFDCFPQPELMDMILSL